MTKKQKKNLIRICICLAAFAAAFIVDKIIDLGSVIRQRKGRGYCRMRVPRRFSRDRLRRSVKMPSAIYSAVNFSTKTFRCV